MIYWAKRHQCVSCQYWDGRRKVQKDSRVVETNCGEKGRCMGPNSRYRGKLVDCSMYVGGGRCYDMWYYLSE